MQCSLVCAHHANDRPPYPGRHHGCLCPWSSTTRSSLQNFFDLNAFGSPKFLSMNGAKLIMPFTCN